jgi:ActR/RegA family two-component response regulator
MKTRVLFVDDELNIRVTLPAILERRGFEVAVAATVPEALDAIRSKKFDVLLSDLNIGDPGDGFTVVSAMRRSQPECRTIILTGFPDFDKALRSIREQADDYLVKPARIDGLVEILQRRLSTEKASGQTERMPLGELLQRNKQLVLDRWLADVKSRPEFQKTKLSDQELIDHLPIVIDEVVLAIKSERSESTALEDLTPQARAAAQKHGKVRKEQGYSIQLILKEVRLLQKEILKLVQENLLNVDMSSLVQQIITATDALEALFGESLTIHANRKKPLRAA